MAEESSLRTALDAIMDWEGTPEGKPEAPGGSVAAPRSGVVNLGTTAELENVVPPEAESPFATELAALQASNADLAKQIAEMPALPVATTPTAAAPKAAPVTTYQQPYVPPPTAPAPLPQPGYGAGAAGYGYNAAMNTNPYSSTNVGPGYGAGSKGYGYDAYWAMNPYMKK